MMEKTKKLTQKDYFNMIIELATANNRMDLVDFCKGRMEVLDRKNSSKTESKTQILNKGIKENLLVVLANLGTSQCKDIVKAYNEQYNTDFSVNKISSLMTQLSNDNLVVRTEEKGKAYFTVR